MEFLRDGLREDMLETHHLHPFQDQQDHIDHVFQSLSDEQRIFGEDFASTPGSDPIEGAASADEQDPNRPKRKRYHRHTVHQIQQLEAFFKECPHPDDKQRKELSRELGLEPLQIKFWFQNKRTQLKNQNERHENQRLKDENDRLLAENLRYKEALSSACCPNCGGTPALGETSFDEQQLRIENARLRDEIDRISAIAAKYAAKPIMSYSIPSSAGPSRSPIEFGFGGVQAGLIGAEGFAAEEVVPKPVHNLEVDRPFAIALAHVAMVELLDMAQLGEPLWSTNVNCFTETLNEEEYARRFPGGLGPKMPEMTTEISRDTAVVYMDYGRLVDIFMDTNNWGTFFSSIVSRATTVETYSSGSGGNQDGALLLMTAELQVPSPLVPLRESLFLRYCKQQVEGCWVIVDVSLEVRHNPIVRYRKRPSGCLIQEMPNGYSKVTWVEHVEVDDRAIHDMYKPVVNSGITFGAKRWIATLARQCERLASLIAINSSSNHIDANPEAMKNILKLAERMVVSYCSGVSGSSAHHWSVVSGSGADDVMIRSRKNNGVTGRPPGTVLNASTSLWLPASPKSIYDFLRSETSRNEWDILLQGGVISEATRIENSHDPENCVSIFYVGDAAQGKSMMILQESCFDPTCSYVIYTPINSATMSGILGGGDPDYVALLPSGFAILPDGTSGTKGADGNEAGSGGSLLTVSFQILVDTSLDSKISLGSVATVNSLVSCTCNRIKDAILGDNHQ